MRLVVVMLYNVEVTCYICLDSKGGCQSVHYPYLNSDGGHQYGVQVSVVVYGAVSYWLDL